MVDIQVNDIILDEGRFFKVIFVDYVFQTMDVKGFNESIIYRCVPIANLSEPGVQILKEIPQNVKFLRSQG